MLSKGRRIRARGAAISVLAVLAVLLGTAASAGADTASEGARSAASAQAAPAGKGADAVQDKFRKFQAEMAQGGDARDSQSTAPAEAPEPGGVFSMSLQVLFGLAFVLLLAVAGIRGLKRLQGRMLSRPGASSGGDLLEVLETCHLGQNQRVVALRINDEVGIVGVTPSGINLITMLKQPADEIRRTRMGPGNPAAFSESLNKLLDRFKKPKRVSDLLDEA